MQPQHQLSLQLIRHNVNGGVIEQRASDGYVNATQLCIIAGKRWHNYVREETTGTSFVLFQPKRKLALWS